MARLTLALFALLPLIILILHKIKQRKQRQKAPSDSTEKEMLEAPIIGKCRYKIRHSKPHIRSYEKSEVSGNKESIFASETKSKQSSDGSKERDNEMLYITRDIDDVPCYIATEASLTLDNEEERTIPRSTESEAEFSKEIGVDSLLYALSIIAKPSATKAEQKACATLLPKLENTELMSRLQSNETYAQRIDKIVNSNYSEQSRAKVANGTTLLGGLIDLEKLLNVKESKR